MQFKASIGFILVSIFILIGCSSDTGPCEWYEEEKFFAEVTAIDFKNLNEEGDSLFEVEFTFDRGSLGEKPQKLSELKDVVISSNFINRNKIKMGVSYTGVITDLKSGNCEAPIVSFDQKMR